jgi:hypothetical protein
MQHRSLSIMHWQSEALTKLDTALRIQYNVSRIQIAMYDVQIMEMSQTIDDLK